MKQTRRILAFVLLLVFLMSTFSVTSFAKSSSKSTVSGVGRVSVSINGDPKTTRGFCWYTAKSCGTTAKLYVNGKDVTSKVKFSYAKGSKWENNYMHKLTVTNLTPGTTYTYKVGDGTTWSKTGTFTTDNGDDKVNMIVIADVQASNASSFAVGANTLQKAFDTMPDYDFVANLGDFTNDCDNEEWDAYDAAFKDLNLKYTIAPVAGNHDGFSVWNWFNNMFNLDTSESVQTLNGVNYSYDYGNAHIAVLNTNDMASLSDSQVTWLERDLMSTSKDWKIIFMHKSPYTLGKDGKWMEAGYTRPVITDVADKCGVDLVMSGHDHMYLRTKTLKNNKVSADGTTYVLAGTAGKKRYEIREFMADTFMDTKFIAALTVQEKGFGNYWDPIEQDWDQSKDTNIGGCFNTVQIDGGNLTLKSYIVQDGTNKITNIDTYTVSKAVGQNTATYSGDNTTSSAAYAASTVSSALSLAAYTVTSWLPTFVSSIPGMIKNYKNGGSF